MDRIQPIEAIPERTKVNPEYISHRDVKGPIDFKKKLDE